MNDLRTRKLAKKVLFETGLVDSHWEIHFDELMTFASLENGILKVKIFGFEFDVGNMIEYQHNKTGINLPIILKISSIINNNFYLKDLNKNCSKSMYPKLKDHIQDNLNSPKRIASAREKNSFEYSFSIYINELKGTSLEIVRERITTKMNMENYTNFPSYQYVIYFKGLRMVLLDELNNEKLGKIIANLVNFLENENSNVSKTMNLLVKLFSGKQEISNFNFELLTDILLSEMELSPSGIYMQEPIQFNICSENYSSTLGLKLENKRLILFNSFGDEKKMSPKITDKMIEQYFSTFTISQF